MCAVFAGRDGSGILIFAPMPIHIAVVVHTLSMTEAVHAQHVIRSNREFRQALRSAKRERLDELQELFLMTLCLIMSC